MPYEIPPNIPNCILRLAALVIDFAKIQEINKLDMSTIPLTSLELVCALQNSLTDLASGENHKKTREKTNIRIY